MKRVVDSFTVGGTKAGMSMPGPKLQEMLGRRIQICVESMTLYVPTANGVETARKGDRIVLFEDGALDVEHAW